MSSPARGVHEQARGSASRQSLLRTASIGRRSDRGRLRKDWQRAGSLRWHQVDISKLNSIGMLASWTIW